MTRQIRIILLLLLTCIGLNIQTVVGKFAELDSLHRELVNVVPGTNKQFEILSKIGMIHLHQEVNKSRVYADSIISLATKMNSDYGFYKGYNLRAAVYYYQGEIDKSVNILEEAIAAADRLGDKRMMLSVKGNMGTLHLSLNNYEKSYKLLHEVYVESRKIKFYELMGGALINMGKLLDISQNYEAAIRKVEIFHELYRNDEIAASISPIAYGKSFEVLIKSYIALKDYKKAWFNIVKSEDLLADKLRNTRYEIELNTVKGIYFLDQKKFNRAERAFDKAVAVSKHLKQNLRPKLREEITRLYYERGEYEKTIEYGLSSLSEIRSAKTLVPQVGINNMLAQSHAALGQYKQAKQYSLDYIVLKDSLNNAIEENNLLDAYYTKIKEEEEIKGELLTMQNTVTTSQAKNRMLFLLTVFCFLGVLFIIGAYLYHQQQIKNKEKYLLDIEIEDRTQELKASHEQLKKKNCELERFTYITSHDLKEPLRNIKSFTGLLKAEAKDNQAVSDELGGVVGKITQMQSLIMDVLAYAKVEELNLEREKTDLKEVLAKIKQDKDLSKLIASKDALIIAPHLPVIEANKEGLGIIFKQLISNGILYNEREQPNIEILCTKEGRNYIIEVIDNGIGIKPNAVDKIFMMFTSMNRGQKYNKGTGVGLTMCKKVAQLMGGDIFLRSSSNSGSVFTIQLPIDKPNLVKSNTVEQSSNSESTSQYA